MSGASRIAGSLRFGCARSSRQDLDLLFRREAPRLMQYFRRRTGSSTDALDLTQEAFTRMAGVSTAGPITSPQRYLQRIARNLLFDRSRGAPPALPLAPDREIAVRAEQEDGIHCRDLIARYKSAVAGLTPRTRQVFVMHREGERSYAQIACDLDISVSTVEYHISRAIVAIGEALEEG